MSALGHYFEREGIATTQISLVREHTELMVPPRALWVPFMLGRPFGAPGIPEFQRKVLIAVLRLLEAGQGPVPEDFPEDAPADGKNNGMEGFACPVNFAKPSSTEHESTDPEEVLLAEMARLQPWYDLAQRRRGRTTVGLSGIPVRQAAQFIASQLGNQSLPTYDARMSAGEALKRACDDIKAFYAEAVSAQPGNLDSHGIDQWFWVDTQAGKLFLQLRDICVASPDRTMQLLGKSMLVPRAIAHTIAGGFSPRET